MALCGCNHRFVTVSSDKKVMATSETAKEKEMIKVSVTSVCCQVKVVVVLDYFKALQYTVVTRLTLMAHFVFPEIPL